MAMGNGLGFNVNIAEDELFNLGYGSIVFESPEELSVEGLVKIGSVTCHGAAINGEVLDMKALEAAYEGRYSKLYPVKVPPQFNELAPESSGKAGNDSVMAGNDRPSILVYPGDAVQTPIVCLPVFPGSNCDYDTAKAFRKAGAEVKPFIFRNITPAATLESIDALAEAINEAHILAFCGGFSSGDEPDGSGKFIANVIGNAKISAAISALQARGGLILGICNGFQALVKSGLLPY